MKRDAAKQSMELSEIEELIRVLEQSEVSELAIRKGDWGVTIRKGRPSLAVQPAVVAQGPPAVPAPKPSEISEPREVALTAPMVGIFHALERGPKDGDTVRPGQVLGVIESMKLMNDVRSDVGGTVVSAAVEDGTPVEYGQPLFRIRPAQSAGKEAS